MQQTWRWFGPDDPIALTKIRQAGATGVVTALHHVPVGEAWPRAEVAARRVQIEAAGLGWQVVESLPVHSDVRLAVPGYERYIENYIASLEHLAAEGIRSVVYNFMPVIDWTRTELSWRAPDGSLSLRFDATQWVVFDVHLLQRPGAERDYSAEQLQRARAAFEQMDESAKAALVANIAAGLPGANETGHSLDGLRRELERWSKVDSGALRERLVAFLKAVMPTAERVGIRLCIHPDDPPRPLLGLPRIASTQADFEGLFAAVPSPCNGLTLCVGSLGAGVHNDLLAIAERFAPRVHFAHLRSVNNEPDGSFTEADHLDGDVDLVSLISVLVREERRRTAAGEPSAIALRPDHGRTLEGDIAELPGYSWLGRLKGLAELRGVIRAVEQLT
jgi:mannonate dehydratase